MNQLDDLTIRRRPDGSIDTDFYARRAEQMRCTAIRQAPVDCFRGLVRLASGLTGGASGRRVDRWFREMLDGQNARM